MKEIILSGGLGNQMFEYAFYLSCKERGIKIKLNTDLYKVDAMHTGYMLSKVFNIPQSELSKSNPLSILVTRFICHYEKLGLAYFDSPMKYDKVAYTTNKKYYLGCFINPLYFKDISDLVLNTFQFKGIDQDNSKLAEKVKQVESVSLHIRRGDYLKNSIYGVCDGEYYKKAIELVNSKIDNPKFYVFSDDPEWCKGFMLSQKVNHQIITHNTGVNSYKDMYLMTQCKHNIIANSTFSWWGAWLNRNKSKLVLCPNKWTTSIPMTPNPQKWVYIEV